jgi:hypothetical protein
MCTSKALATSQLPPGVGSCVECFTIASLCSFRTTCIRNPPFAILANVTAARRRIEWPISGPCPRPRRFWEA